jgi:hypothetical protein
MIVYGEEESQIVVFTSLTRLESCNTIHSQSRIYHSQGVALLCVLVFMPSVDERVVMQLSD